MDERRTGSLQMLRPHLREVLAALPADVQDEVIVRLGRHLETVPAPAPGRVHRGIDPGIGDVWYAFHTSEARVLETAAATIAGAIAFTAPVALVAGLVVLHYNLRRLRFELTLRQMLVLRLLIDAGPRGLTPGDVADRLPGDHLLTPDEVSAVLAEIRALPRADGKDSPLVREAAGRWVAVDV